MNCKVNREQHFVLIRACTFYVPQTPHLIKKTMGNIITLFDNMLLILRKREEPSSFDFSGRNHRLSVCH